MDILIFIITLSLLILIHEFGHFLMAKKNGVKVEEFGIGLPPKIFGIKKGETLFSVNLLPIGGFVKLFGEEYHEVKNKKEAKRAFINRSFWQKFLIITGGVLGNFILGWLILSFLLTQGLAIPTNKVTIEKVVKNSPAEKAGLKEKDVILMIKKGREETHLKNTNDLINLTKKYAGEKIELVIKRNEKNITIFTTPRKNPPKNEGPLGVVISSFEIKKVAFYQAPFSGFIDSVKIVYQIFSELILTIYNLINQQQVSVEVAGPVGIANFAKKAINFGYAAYLQFLALLSFNLAVINILPFPALDGGRLVFVLYEGLTKRKPNKEIEKIVNLCGMIVLLILAILVTINDFRKLK